MYRDLREPGTGKLLCRYDPERRLLEFVRRGTTTVVKLEDFEKENAHERQDTSLRAPVVA